MPDQGVQGEFVFGSDLVPQVIRHLIKRVAAVPKNSLFRIKKTNLVRVRAVFKEHILEQSEQGFLGTEREDHILILTDHIFRADQSHMQFIRLIGNREYLYQIMMFWFVDKDTDEPFTVSVVHMLQKCLAVLFRNIRLKSGQSILVGQLIYFGILHEQLMPIFVYDDLMNVIFGHMFRLPLCR